MGRLPWLASKPGRHRRSGAWAGDGLPIRMDLKARLPFPCPCKVREGNQEIP